MKSFKFLIVFILIFQTLLGPVAFATVSPSNQLVDTDASNTDDLDQKTVENTLQNLFEGYRNPFDTFGLFDQGLLVSNRYFLLNRPALNNLGVKIASSDQNRPIFFHEQRAESVLEARPFTIYFQSKPILSFHMPVTTVGFYKNYLVFLEQGSAIENVNVNGNGNETQKVQYLSFIDLKKYLPALETGTLPIFSIPVGVDEAVLSLEVKEDMLILKGSSGSEVSRLNERAFANYSNVQELALDVSASLTDPESYEDLKPLVESVVDYFYKATLEDPSKVEDQFLLQKSFFEKLKSTLASRANPKPEDVSGELLKGEHLKKTLASLEETLIVRRNLTSRLHLLFTTLISTPTDLAPLKLKQALGLIAAGQLREGVLQTLFNRKVQLGSAVVASCFLSQVYPEEFHHYLFEALEVSRASLVFILGHVRGIIENSTSLLGHATKVTVSGFNQHVFYKAYLSGEKANHFFIGLAGFTATAVSLVGLPILTVNTWKLIRDLKQLKLPGLGELISSEGFFGGFQKYIQTRKDAFVIRQREQLQKYLNTQSKSFADQAKRMGQEIGTEFTEEQNKQVDEIFSEMNRQNSTWMSKFFGKVSEWKPFKTKENGVEKEFSEKQVYDFKTAFSNFLFSYSSITGAFESLARGWNGFTVFRLIVLTPTLWISQIFYPNLINGSLGDGDSKGLVFPSKLNSGEDGAFDFSKRLISSLLISNKMNLVRAFEKKILPIENEIVKKSVQTAFEMLSERMKEQGSYLDNVSKLGKIKTLSDKKLYELTLKERTYFRVLVENLYEQSLQKYLSSVVAGKNAAPVLESNTSLKNLKEAALTEIEKLTLSEQEVDRLVESAKPQAHERAKQVSEQMFKELGSFMEGTRVNLKHRALRIVDPKNNPTMERIQVVLEMLKKPDSMPRAVRSTISSLLMAKTFGLAMTLFGLAGIEGGVLQPLHDEMFGPNSYFYLGRLPFLGILSGLITGVFASPWVKLQVDHAHSKHFGEVPEGEDAKLSMPGWYVKQTFKNPENKWWANQKNQLKISWRNMKPALVLITLQCFSNLGRFDLDGYFVSYLIFFMNPLVGFNTKLEQGVEFASFYYLKYFPRELRGHPRVVQWLARKQQGLRFIFSIYEKLWVDLQETIIGSFSRMNYNGHTEAFSRVLLFGYTMTELSTLLLEKVKNSPLGIIPGVKPVANFCELVLTRNYQAWEKVKKP